MGITADHGGSVPEDVGAGEGDGDGDGDGSSDYSSDYLLGG